jgi:hypothetical protein
MEVAPALVLPEVTDAPAHEPRQFPWIHEPASSTSPEAAIAGSLQTPPKDERRACRFIESSELL